MLGQRSIYHEGWLACTLHPPHIGLGEVRPRRVGALPPRADRAAVDDLAAEEPRTARGDEEPVVLLRRHLQRPAARRPHRARAGARRAPARGARPRPVRLLPRTAPTCPSRPGVAINGRSYTIAAGVELDSADAEGVLYAHGGVAGGHSLYVKDRRLHYAFNWIGTHLQDVVADRELTPGRHVLTAEFAGEGPSADPAMPGFVGHPDPLRRRPAGRDRDDRHPAGLLLPRRRRHLRRARRARRRSRPTTGRRSAFTGGDIDKVVVDVSGDRYVDHEAQVRAWFSSTDRTGGGASDWTDGPDRGRLPGGRETVGRATTVPGPPGPPR